MAAIVSPYGTLSFPCLFSPKPRSRGGEPVYSCAILFSPATQKTPEYLKLKQACKDAFVEKFDEKSFTKGVESPFKDAGEKEYGGYDEGWTFISPWSKNKPGIVDVNLQQVLTPDEVYAGQIVRVYLNPFAWEHSGRKGVSFGLNGVQIIDKNAPRIDGRVAIEKAFNDGVQHPTAMAEADSDSPF